MDGWIRLHRKIRENPIFSDMQLFRLWIICLTEATHKERDQLVGRQMVHLLPGEFVTGRFDLEGMYNRGLKPDQQKSPKTVWRWLESLENSEYLTIKTTNKFSVISILNWHKYQSNDHEIDQQMTNKRPTNDQQVTTNKNVNNSFTTTTDEPITLDKVHYKVFGNHIMTGLMTGFVQQVKRKGYTDAFLVELMLEMGESATKPSLRLLETIFERWDREKIYTRIESKRRREEEKRRLSASTDKPSEREAKTQQRLAEERKAEIIPLSLTPEFETKEVAVGYDAGRPTGTL